MTIIKELEKELSFQLPDFVNFVKTEGACTGLIEYNRQKLTVYYQTKTQLAHAILQIKRYGFEKPYRYEIECAFENLRVMVDCSRNAVLNLPTVKRLIRLLALMGYNGLMLYTEDTYEVDNEPYFGYLRGRYSQAELAELDAYAARFGVELIPCIQTLAHLNSITRWGEYIPIIDCNDILLTEEARTYELIDNMFASLRKVYTTKRLHIGMDEAHMVGLGKYLDKHGYTNRFEILKRHLEKVLEIAKKYGFEPMMWSDMYFRLANHGAYTPIAEDKIEEIKKHIPADVELIYWDYYSKEESHYDAMIENHKKLTEKLSFADGIYHWVGYAPMIDHTVQNIQPATKSCIKNGVKSLLATIWGDDGGEGSVYNNLPALAYQAELAYHGGDASRVGDVFYALTGIEYDAFCALELVNVVGDYPHTVQNPCKYMLFNDPLLGVMDCLVVDGDKEKLLTAIEKLKAGEKTAYGLTFKTLRTLSEVIYLKYDLGVRTRSAYQSGNKEELGRLCNHEYKKLRRLIDKFYTTFRAQWYDENKPHGFDVQDIRIGGLIQRLKNTRRTIAEYVQGKRTEIPELEEKILNFHCNVDYEKTICCNKWTINSTCNVL